MLSENLQHYISTILSKSFIFFLSKTSTRELKKQMLCEQDLDYLMEMGAADKADVEENKEEIIQLGFNFYHLLIRLQDIHGPDPLPSSESELLLHNQGIFNPPLPVSPPLYSSSIT